MTITDGRDHLRRQAERIAYALSVVLYLREDGSVHLKPPGEKIDPGPRARPQPHGHDPKTS
jgi:hypothetical protein